MNLEKSVEPTANVQCTESSPIVGALGETFQNFLTSPVGCIDWVYDEDRSTIRMGHDPVNMTRLRRFAIGLIKSKGAKNVSKQTRALNRNVCAVFDYFKMTKNSQKLYWT